VFSPRHKDSSKNGPIGITQDLVLFQPNVNIKAAQQRQLWIGMVEVKPLNWKEQTRPRFEAPDRPITATYSGYNHEDNPTPKNNLVNRWLVVTSDDISRFNFVVTPTAHVLYGYQGLTFFIPNAAMLQFYKFTFGTPCIRSQITSVFSVGKETKSTAMQQMLAYKCFLHVSMSLTMNDSGNFRRT
jgi:hypothetical protein